MHLLGFTQFVCFSFDGQFTRKKYINFGIRYAFRSHDLFKLKLILKIKSYLYTQCAVCASVSLIRRQFSHMPKYPPARSLLVHAVLFTPSSVAHAGLFMLAARSSYHVRKLLDCRC